MAEVRIAFIAMGWSVHTIKWVSYFRDLGHEVMLISFHPPEKIERIRIEFIDRRNWLSKLASLFRIKKLLRQFQPDILHAHYASSCGLIAALTGFHPFVLSVWGDDIMVFPKRSFVHRWAIRTTIIRADKVTATSRILARKTIELSRGKKEADVVPFGVNLQRFICLERPASDSVHIGTVRWLTPKYGIDNLIMAFARLVEKRPDLKLTIIGLGPMREELEQLARTLGVDSQVTFTGHLSHEEVLRHLAEFDLFAIPSLSEGETFGVAAVEAMATGLPVVASRIGGLPEVVVHDETGLLVPPGDIEALTDSLQQYIDSPRLRKKHGLAGRARVEKLYDWNENAAQMLHLYEKILKED